MKIFRVHTSGREVMLDITDELARLVQDSRITTGVLVAYSPHTTTGLTINEGADPDVCRDILTRLRVLVPRQAHFLHAEGNADAHIKASLLGSSVQIIVQDRQLALGTWQRVFLGEFDGPRTREIWVYFLT